MNSVLHQSIPEISGEFLVLKKKVDVLRTKALKERLISKPLATDTEFLLGAFLQMYEPHLEKFVHLLLKKGYALDPSSGFGGKNAELQILSGNFALDFISRNKIEKLGVKFREYNNFNSLVFWPTEATIEQIVKNWTQIVNILPNKGELKTPSMSTKAIQFRRKYKPQKMGLQNTRLFEKLRFGTQQKTKLELQKRIEKNPRPTKDESILGLFAEELEPQVRQAIFDLHKKGYSTDASGFMEDPCDQMIEGDFQLDEKTIENLQKLGVFVETNPSGYTRVQFTPLKANISEIKKKWNKIVAVFADKKKAAETSMTKKAREFRVKYQ